MSPTEPLENGNPLAPYLDTPIRLFIHDPVLKNQTAQALKIIGFTQVSQAGVQPNFFQAMRQLYGELAGSQGLVLVNHPSKQMKDASGYGYQDAGFAEFYQGVASLNTSSRRTSEELLGKCVPIMVSAQDADIRMKVVSDLFSFGILGAFMLAVQPLGMSKAEQVEERAQELREYLTEYFTSRDQKQVQLKEHQTAAELAQRREEAEKLMTQVEQHKQAGDYDKAIALCRQAAEVLPSDPQAYLEGGRLLVKKRRYPPAMQMFRDAEKVANDSPMPHQEIAACRVTQVKEYVTSRMQAGQEVDQAQIDGWMNEAMQGFQAAMKKAADIKGVDSQRSAERQAEAQAALAEQLLTTNLDMFLGPDSEFVRQTAALARQALEHSPESQGQEKPRHLVQFALLAFQEGRPEEARRLLAQAAQDPETYDEACAKLNYMGTQLRRTGKPGQAVETYRQLLELRPSFRGVAMFNLGVALRTQARQVREAHPKQAASLEREALAECIQALYVDPHLPQEEGFYKNTVVADLLQKAQAVFAAAARAQPPKEETPAQENDAVAKACRAASRKVEGLLKEGNEREALQTLFQLARTLKPFFLNFDRHASPEVQAFAQRLHPRLIKHPQAKMQIFGKVLGVLVQRGKQARQQAASRLDPAFAPVMAALEQARQDQAASRLAVVLVGQPKLAAQGAHAVDSSLLNLCREMASKLKGVEVERFSSATRAADAG